MEFIKNENYQSDINIEVVTSLPVSGTENQLIILKNDGLYCWENNRWELQINFAAEVGGIIGEVRACIGTPGSDWLFCDGSQYDTSEYPELYALIGTDTLPDFRERELVGVGENTTDTIADHDVFTLGQKKGRGIQNHYHNNTECNHLHTHKQGAHCHTLDYGFTLYAPSISGSNFCVVRGQTDKCTSVSSPAVTVGTSDCWSTPTVGNPPNGTVVRMNNYGVGFYIRAK